MEITKNVMIPYNDHTKGGRALAKALNLQFLKRGMVNFGADLRPYCKMDSLKVINWGSYSVPLMKDGQTVLNPPEKIKVCSDKLTFFKAVEGRVRIPVFTTDCDTAVGWERDGITTFGRTRRGSGGEGIYLFNEDLDKWYSSEFWVQYKKKKDEFRVHVMKGEVILVQRKALRTTDHLGNPIDRSEVNFMIRNHDNGFIFQRNDVQPPEDVITQAKLSIDTLGLDFGAVDVIYNGTEKKAYVLEVNTAPGLEGTTVEDYTNAFRTFFA